MLENGWVVVEIGSRGKVGWGATRKADEGGSVVWR